jgi:hypothetical protein
MPAERAYVANMSRPAPMTADDLLHVRIPEKRIELVKGVLVVREPAGGRHGRVTTELSSIPSAASPGSTATTAARPS